MCYHTKAYTGLRRGRGELLGLRWGGIDLEVATLSMVQTLQQLLCDSAQVFGYVIYKTI